MDHVLLPLVGSSPRKNVISRDVNGTDNFRSESASVFVFKDMVRNYGNPTDTDADKDIR